MKIINEKKKNKKKCQEKKNQGNGSYSERVRDKWFCGAFKLCFM